MKKLIYDSVLLLLGCLLWTACNNDEDLTVVSTEGAKTELGQKIIDVYKRQTDFKISGCRIPLQREESDFGGRGVF